MFVSAKTVKGECVCFNVCKILFVIEGKKNNAIVLTVDGDSFELAESCDNFCQRLIESSNVLLCSVK